MYKRQAEEDVNYLFDAFYYDFAFYDYFGGHAVFDQAKADKMCIRDRSRN